MKKKCFGLVFAFIFLSAVIGIKAQSPISAFTGNWMLDREKTKISKDFPQKLKNYKMMVGESDNLLSVKSQVDGEVEVVAAGRGATVVNESASRLGTATRTGDTGSVAGTSKINYGGTMAIFFTPNDAVYNLSGEEVKVEMKQGDKVSGIARIKAKLDKSGKSLQITTIRRMKTPTGEMEVTTREVWKLSEDGKSIKFQRTVETPSARDEIVMMLAKVS